MVDTKQVPIQNPFRPGAGHMPPHLAGRENEKREFHRLLMQDTILQNFILTGLRGVGKTVLLETLKPMAIQEGWLWVGTDMSESTSVSETSLATRLLADLSVVTSTLATNLRGQLAIGFGGAQGSLNFATLTQIYLDTPGLVADKLKTILETVWQHLSAQNKRGLIFAYDEAQNLSDHAAKEQFPLSILLDVFQSIQRKGIPFMLALTGLPTLFPKLVEARTYSERMFRVLFLDRLSNEASRDAIEKPMQGKAMRLEDPSISSIIEISGGYPYFIQFICREFFDVVIQKLSAGETPVVPAEEILIKLDSDFFAGRWARATDRQRELLVVAATLPTAGTEFTVQELVEASRYLLSKPFSSSHVNQMLVTLSEAGLVYKNRHGKYSFAVPLLHKFIIRQHRLFPAAGQTEGGSIE
jgi:hypothetical protein